MLVLLAWLVTALAVWQMVSAYRYFRHERFVTMLYPLGRIRNDAVWLLIAKPHLENSIQPMIREIDRQLDWLANYDSRRLIDIIEAQAAFRAVANPRLAAAKSSQELDAVELGALTLSVGAMQEMLDALIRRSLLVRMVLNPVGRLVLRSYASVAVPARTFLRARKVLDGVEKIERTMKHRIAA